jgi:hypothetical protein
MRHFFWMGVVLSAGLTLASTTRTQAQAPAAGQSPSGGYGQGQGQGRQRGGGFGGGQNVTGIVTAAVANKVTIKTEAGDTYDVTLTADTRLMRDRQPIKLADVKPGDSVTAIGTIDATAKTVAAMMVMDVDADTVKKAKEDLGKTYITGKITAIDADNLKLTILRPDGVSQVIAVDEGTSFQKGARGISVPSIGGMGMGGMGGGRGFGGGGGAAGPGAAPAAPESITLADIKVGDTVVATGAIKSGSFTPVKMGVSEPMAPGAGRRRNGAGADGAGGPSRVPPAPPQ